MFKEIPNVRQIKGDPKRKWFCDSDLEIIIWFDEQEKIVGFQLCYEVNREPKALTWTEDEGYHHTGIDDGDLRGGRYKATPILIPDGEFNKELIEERFRLSSEGLPKGIKELVMDKIAEYKA